MTRTASLNDSSSSDLSLLMRSRSRCVAPSTASAARSERRSPRSFASVDQSTPASSDPHHSSSVDEPSKYGRTASWSRSCDTSSGRLDSRSSTRASWEARNSSSSPGGSGGTATSWPSPPETTVSDARRRPSSPTARTSTDTVPAVTPKSITSSRWTGSGGTGIGSEPLRTPSQIGVAADMLMPRLRTRWRTTRFARRAKRSHLDR